MSVTARRITAAVLVLLGVVLALSANPSGSSSSVSAIRLKAEINNGSAAGAPQQTVVNGWEANDLLALQVSQDQSNAWRLALLLLLILIALAVLLVTVTRPAPQAAPAAPAPAAYPPAPPQGYVPQTPPAPPVSDGTVLPGPPQ